VNFANLAPGSYRFLVRAVNSDGIASPVPASITFKILLPVWQRWWFISLAALAFAGIAYAAYRYRISRLLEVANVRTRIATDLHDDIGANLTKIAILSEVARQELGTNGAARAEGPLSSIARISRESVASMSDIVWAINPQRDTLRDLVRRIRQHAEEVCLSQNIEVTFNAPDREPHLRLGVDVRRDLYLIFKEAITNSVRHSKCTRLEIELAHEGEVLTLTISDNGRGFDPEDQADGNGLINMRRRAERHAGKLVIDSQSGRGTTIKVRFPRARSRRALPT
jgi:signal transduction histidine kinase